MFKDVNGYTYGQENGEMDSSWISWGLFAETGNPMYYLMYRDLLDEKIDEEK